MKYSNHLDLVPVDEYSGRRLQLAFVTRQSIQNGEEEKTNKKQQAGFKMSQFFGTPAFPLVFCYIHREREGEGERERERERANRFLMNSVFGPGITLQRTVARLAQIYGMLLLVIQQVLLRLKTDIKKLWNSVTLFPTPTPTVSFHRQQRYNLFNGKFKLERKLWWGRAVETVLQPLNSVK